MHFNNFVIARRNDEAISQTQNAKFEIASHAKKRDRNDENQFTSI